MVNRIKTDFGPEAWLLDGKLHREDGPAVTEPDGTEFWYQHDKLHRVGGPAIVYTCGTQYWFFDGKLHRNDGPAIIRHDGMEVRYYINNIAISSAKAFQSCTGISDEALAIMILKFGKIE